MDTNTVQVISEKVLESTAQDMTGKYVWMFLAGLVILIFKVQRTFSEKLFIIKNQDITY